MSHSKFSLEQALKGRARPPRDTVPEIPAIFTLLSNPNLVKWYEFGVLLKVPPRELRRLEDEHPRNVDRRILGLLDYWLKNSEDPSWEKVLEALMAIPEERELANKLLDEIFPVVSLSKFSKEVLRKELALADRHKLAVSLDSIQTKFANLVIDTQEALERKVPFDRIKRFVKAYLHNTFAPQHDPRDIDDLFDQLRLYYCFMNYGILKKIVNRFIKESMGEHMEEYTTELNKWLKSTTVQEFKAAVEEAAAHPAAVANPSSNEQQQQQCYVVLRLEGEWLKVTVNNLQKLLKHLFGEKSSILTRIEIKEGSVIVRLMAPQSEMLSLLTLASKKKEDMAYLGIHSIQVGNLQFSSQYAATDAGFSFETSLIHVILQSPHNLMCMQFLLKLGVNPNNEVVLPVNDFKITPLAAAAQLGALDAMSLLVKYKADVHSFDSRDYSPLYYAILFNQPEAVLFLLKAGVSPDHCIPSTRHTPLMGAALFDRVRIVKLLLQNQANVDIQDLQLGISALVFACANGNIASAQLLLEAGADPNLKDSRGFTCLHSVCNEGYLAIAELLLRYKADPNIQSDNGLTPLMIACLMKYNKIAKLLIQSGAYVNLLCSKSFMQVSALLIASSDNNTPLMNLLLTANADVNIQDHLQGITAMHYACIHGNEEMVERFLEAGADPNRCTHDGSSPLMVAFSHNHLNLVLILIRGGADPNVNDKKYNTALHEACYTGNEDITQLLLQSEAKVDVLDRFGNTPLCIAAGKGHTKIVQQLLEAGADTELQRNKRGWTPVFYATAGGHLETVELLLKHSASLGKDKFGKNPQNAAAEMGHLAVEHHLSQVAVSKQPQSTAPAIDEEEKQPALVNEDESSDNIASYYKSFLSTLSSSMESIQQFFNNAKKHMEYKMESLKETIPRFS